MFHRNFQKRFLRYSYAIVETLNKKEEDNFRYVTRETDCR